MSVNAANLRDEIIALFPGDWVWTPGKPNYTFLDALCSGFVAMWGAGILTPGLGPPPPGSYPHTHAITTLVAATMAASAKALGYTTEANDFVDAVSGAVSSHLISNTVMDVQQGEVSHKHGYTSFGSASVLKAAIIAATPLTGVGIAPWADAVATALIAHLTANADMSMALGAAHLHTLS